MNIYEKIESGYYKELERNWKHDEFKLDLEIEFQVEDNPKKDKLFYLAWEYGHAYGLNDVYSYYCNLVELIN